MKEIPANSASSYPMARTMAINEKIANNAHQEEREQKQELKADGQFDRNAREAFSGSLAFEP